MSFVSHDIIVFSTPMIHYHTLSAVQFGSQSKKNVDYHSNYSSRLYIYMYCFVLAWYSLTLCIYQPQFTRNSVGKISDACGHAAGGLELLTSRFQDLGYLGSSMDFSSTTGMLLWLKHVETSQNLYGIYALTSQNWMLYGIIYHNISIYIYISNRYME